MLEIQRPQRQNEATLYCQVLTKPDVPDSAKNVQSICSLCLLLLYFSTSWFCLSKFSQPSSHRVQRARGCTSASRAHF
jgi:hypothetical protein